MCLMNCAHGAKMNVEPITRMHNGVPICIMRMVATVTGGVELCWDYMAFCDKKEEEMLCACGCGGDVCPAEGGRGGRPATGEATPVIYHININ